MADLTVFPDVPAALVSDLSEFGTTGTVTPDDLQDKLPFIRVVGLPSGDGNLVTDVSVVEVLVFAATYRDASLISRGVQQRMISTPRVITGLGVLPKARTQTRPYEIPYDNQNIRVFTATYRIATRR